MLPFPLLYSLGSAAIAPLLFGYHMVRIVLVIFRAESNIPNPPFIL